jgi:penicillin-binding protein 1A
VIYSMRIKKHLFTGFLILLVFLMLAGVIGTIFLAKEAYSQDLEFHFKKRSTIFDRNGEVISYIYQENREYVPIEKIPQNLQKAIVAIEDRAFWQHKGVNYKSLMRAIIVDIKERKFVQGGSTITQQLVKNMFLTHDKTLIRKAKEAILAMMVEARYTKEEILEYYLNLIYLGPKIYGVGTASEYYFGKPVDKLNLAESALLAGIVNGPGYYSPFINLENAYKRRQIVLDAMVEENFISEEEAKKAAQEEIVLPKHSPRTAPSYFVSETLKELSALGYDLEKLQTKGYKVYTTLDLQAQQIAEKNIKSVPEGFVDNNGLTQPQAALVTLDVENGGILALVGGRGEDHFNRATMARRQPGSTLKPIIYLAALQKGHTAATLVPDAPLSFSDGWQPANYDNKYLGDIAMGYALERSRNMAAVRVLADVGVDKVISLANQLGIHSITREKDRNLALALGGTTEGVTPIEMAAAYATFARGGDYIKPYCVTEVKDDRGQTYYRVKIVPQKIIDEDQAFMITDMLRNVVEYGTGKAARIGRPAAGKTGIADNYTNAWFVGFTPEIASAVWIGNDRQSEPMHFGNTIIGSSMAASVFKGFAQEYLKSYPVKDFAMPENVQRVSIDVYTGKQSSSDQVLIRYYAFQKDNLPAKDKVGFINEVTDKLKQFWQRFFGNN